MPFELIASSGPASPRAGLLSLEHGDVPTPVFMPVGTRAAVRTLTSGELEELGAPIILANAYHIWLRPGTEVIERAGGLNAFMSWERPILTDSGGFQVFSLGDTRRIDDDGVTFRSVYDGSGRRMTPEISVQVQEALGSDVAMAFDECAPYPSEPGVLAEAVRRSADWAARSKAAHTRPVQELFGILQGGTDVALRRESAERTVGLGFDGYAIGGLSVGEPREEMLATLEATVPLLPEDRPRYLMGVGDPVSMMEAVARGIDMFDSVLPTRMARNGGFWTGEGRLNLRNAEYADDLRPLEEGCGCPACRTYSRAYLRHLLMVKEILPLRMLTEHNLHVLIDGARLAREAILAGAFVDFLDGWRARFDRLGQD